VTQRLKLEPSPISQTHVDKVFSPVCRCATDVAHIDFSIRRTERLRIWIRMPAGPVTLANKVFTDGRVHVRWDGRDATGAVVPDGTYFAAVRLQAGRRTIDLPNPIQVDTVKPTVRLLGVQHDGGKTLFYYGASEPAHGLLYVNGRRRVRTYAARKRGRVPYYKPLSARRKLALGAQDVAGNLSRLVAIPGL
jgi:hypothetical protein